MSAITWTQTPTLKELTLPSGNTYWLKDDEVRQWIGDGSTSGAEKRLSDAESAIQALSNATHWIGVTTTTLSDGATTNPITINGESVTAVSGDIVQDSNGQEYIFNGTAWQALGSSVGTLKAFAYADTGDVTITPKGSVSGTAVTLSTDTVGSVTNAGSMPTYTVSNGVLTIGAGVVPTVSNVSVATGVNTVTQPTFTGTQETYTVTPTT